MKNAKNVKLPVRGHSALTPIPKGLNSSDMPKTHMLIPVKINKKLREKCKKVAVYIHEITIFCHSVSAVISEPSGFHI